MGKWERGGCEVWERGRGGCEVWERSKGRLNAVARYVTCKLTFFNFNIGALEIRNIQTMFGTQVLSKEL